METNKILIFSKKKLINYKYFYIYFIGNIQVKSYDKYLNLDSNKRINSENNIFRKSYFLDIVKQLNKIFIDFNEKIEEYLNKIIDLQDNQSIKSIWGILQKLNQSNIDNLYKKKYLKVIFQPDNLQDQRKLTIVFNILFEIIQKKILGNISDEKIIEYLDIILLNPDNLKDNLKLEYIFEIFGILNDNKIKNQIKYLDLIFKEEKLQDNQQLNFIRIIFGELNNFNIDVEKQIKYLDIIFTPINFQDKKIVSGTAAIIAVFNQTYINIEKKIEYLDLIFQLEYFKDNKKLFYITKIFVIINDIFIKIDINSGEYQNPIKYLDILFQENNLSDNKNLKLIYEKLNKSHTDKECKIKNVEMILNHNNHL